MKRTAALLVLSAATACSTSLGGHTTGIDHALEFSYISGTCFFGCDLSEPLMVGTQERLEIKGTLPAVSVVSSDPSILSTGNPSLSCCSTDGSGTTCSTASPQGSCPSGASASLLVDVTALQTGSARIQVLDGGGKEVDAVVVGVEQPASLTLRCGTGNGGDASVAVNASCTPYWTVRDSQGAELRAARGVSLSTSDVNVVALRTGFGPSQASVPGDQSMFGSEAVGVSVGQAVITGTVANLSATTTIHVTP